MSNCRRPDGQGGLGSLEKTTQDIPITCCVHCCVHRFELLNKWESRQDQDGLNTLQYTVQKVEFRPGYTWFLVNIDKDAILKVINYSMRACLRVCVCV